MEAAGGCKTAAVVYLRGRGAYTQHDPKVIRDAKTLDERSECQEPCPRVRPPWVRNHRGACRETGPECQETGPECQETGPEYQEIRPECWQTVLAGYELANSFFHALQFCPFEHLDRQL